MQDILSFEQLEARGVAINLTFSRLCQISGFSYSNAMRWKKNLHKPNVASLERLTQTLLEEEKTIFMHLEKLMAEQAKAADAKEQEQIEQEQVAA